MRWGQEGTSADQRFANGAVSTHRARADTEALHSLGKRKRAVNCKRICPPNQAPSGAPSARKGRWRRAGNFAEWTFSEAKKAISRGFRWIGLWPTFNWRNFNEHPSTNSSDRPMFCGLSHGSLKHFPVCCRFMSKKRNGRPGLAPKTCHENNQGSRFAPGAGRFPVGNDATAGGPPGDLGADDPAVLQQDGEQWLPERISAQPGPGRHSAFSPAKKGTVEDEILHGDWFLLHPQPVILRGLH